MAIVLCVLLWPERRERELITYELVDLGVVSAVGADAGLAVADAAALLN